MDKLQERAIAFKRLLDYEYKIILGRKGKLSYNIISKSRFFDMLSFSKIIADFELKNIYEDLIFYLFIEKRHKSEKQYCKSFIQESNIDYTYGQIKMTLLYKEKINLKTGESIVQYNRLLSSP